MEAPLGDSKEGLVALLADVLVVFHWPSFGGLAALQLAYP